MSCPACGADRYSASAVFCTRCGANMDAVAASATTSRYPNTSHDVAAPQKNPGLAAVLSFFWPGLGQIYNGTIGKGLMMMAAYALCGLVPALAAMAMVRDGRQPGFASIVPLAVVAAVAAVWLWFGGIVGAYRTAQRINEECGWKSSRGQA